MINELSNTEYEIMKVLWELKEPIMATTLLDYFNENFNKNWKIQTLSTFLARLTKKGLIESKREGRSYIFWSVMTENEYKKNQAKNVLQNMYQGSLLNFLSALSGKEKLSQEEVNDLNKWIEEEMD